MGPDFLAPVPLPEVGVGDTEEVAVQYGENGATDNVGTIEGEIGHEYIPYIQWSGVGVYTP